MGRVSQRRHSTEIIWSEYHQIVCMMCKASITDGLLFQDELRGWACVNCVCVCAQFTLPCISNLRVRVTFMPPSPKSCSQFILAAESGAGSRMKEALEIMELFKVMNWWTAFFFLLFFHNSGTQQNNKTLQIIPNERSCALRLRKVKVIIMIKLYVFSNGKQGAKNISTIT